MGLLQHSDATRRWFALLAPGYDSVVSPLFWPDSLQREGIERLAIEEGDRVLDVGCGTGQTIRQVVPRTWAVHGLEQSEQQLEIAASKEELRDVRFVRADAHHLPYVEGTFDGVVTVGSILYWSNPAHVLAEAHRITKPRGKILVMGFNRRSLSAWNPVRNYQEIVNGTLFYRYSPTEATRLFREAGWTNVEHAITGPEWSPELIVLTTATRSD